MLKNVFLKVTFEWESIKKKIEITSEVTLNNNNYL